MEHVTSFPDKKVYVRKNVKLYSDNSMVPHGLYTEFYRSGHSSNTPKGKSARIGAGLT